MARMDWTRIGVAAPGFRPTADEAPMPIKPTPTAAPSAAKPTCTFPFISAKTGINDIYVFLSFFSPAPARSTVEPVKSLKSMVRFSVPLFLTYHHGEDRRQQHEDQRLDKTNQQLHEIKWNRQQPAEVRNQTGHRLHDVFPREDVSI